MPADSEDVASGRRPGSMWLALAIVAAVGGAAAAVAYARTWFPYTAKHCGVVRPYEDLFGIFILGCWLTGAVFGTGMALFGFLKRSKVVILGAIVSALTGLLMALVHMETVHDIRDADYSLKSTPVLMQFLQDTEKRYQAAHELGERRAPQAAPALCAILDNTTEDINLRLNAAMALGKICAPPPPAKATVDQAIASLVRALKDKDRFLPSLAAEALGRTRDSRAIKPLAELLGDRSKDLHTREMAASALGQISGDEAGAALEQARAACNDKDLARRIARIRDRMKKDESPSRARQEPSR